MYLSHQPLCNPGFSNQPKGHDVTASICSANGLYKRANVVSDTTTQDIVKFKALDEGEDAHF